MTVDLSKHNIALKEAWKDVISDKSETNWALFGYEGQTNTLKVVSKGDGGVTELKEDLNSGKVMYAFVKLNDPKTSLDKCVLINWQGEGANRKGLCANHLRDVEKFFTGSHFTYSARNEDEVDEDILIEKLKKLGSEYSFKMKVEPHEPAVPVGTRYQKVNAGKEINSQERDEFWKQEEEEKRHLEVQKRKQENQLRLEMEIAQREGTRYQKVNAGKEINSQERDKFWKKEEEEEKRRLEEERKRKQENQLRLEMETAQREEKETKKRDQESESRNVKIDQFRKIEQDNFKHETEKHNVAPEKPARVSILKANAQNNIEHNLSANYPKKTSPEPTNIEQALSDDESDQYATIKRSPKDPNNTSKTAETPISPTQTEPVDEKVNAAPFVEQTVQMLEQDFVDEYIFGIAKDGYKAKALYDYQAADDTEISFDPGDIITNIEKVDEGWWQGLAPNGITYGLFPANYVELID